MGLLLIVILCIIQVSSNPSVEVQYLEMKSVRSLVDTFELSRNRDEADFLRSDCTALHCTALHARFKENSFCVGSYAKELKTNCQYAVSKKNIKDVKIWCNLV